ncbi:MAG: [FeFe] hydrogenase H-cluster radical SAM maturase HydE [Atopobiaceae bacterium]|nr:[FeFe] hydrogenase H-cluster radical SAM maturase HydE [Atopobiaceae bacterium]
MDARTKELIEELAQEHTLSAGGYEHLVRHQDEQSAALLAEHATAVRKRVYGTDVYVRGLIEFSSICKNDCLYCGLRASNHSCQRYRLSREQILSCTDLGYDLGFRTFVLQGGEDGWFDDDRLCDIVQAVRAQHPDCAITLSVGERQRESYARLREAGADRYLLRHETADPDHYARLHPTSMSFDNRMRCLYDLRDLGYAVGVGMMVGSPYQTPAHLARDLEFIDEFKPEMCGIGPFIPHHATPFASMPAGTLEQTCYLLSIIRLIHPPVLLPATTALGTIDPFGREKGMLAGANVVMPNLSPTDVRSKYLLYDGKICMGDEAAECHRCLELRMERVGYHVVVDRGDPKAAIA